MKAFAALYRELDASTSNLAKQAALQRYLRAADPADAAWAVYFLAGGRPRQAVPTRWLREQARLAAGLPEWLFDESHDAVGDLAETIALLLPPTASAGEGLPLSIWIEHHLLPLRGLPPPEQAERLQAQWRSLADAERLVYFKLMTGAFRVGVSRLQVTQALAAVGGLDPKLVAQRLVGYTRIGARPSSGDYLALIAPPSGAAAEGTQPYPFFLAHPLQLADDRFEAALGPVDDWLIEWKWDGIRAQIVKRAGLVAIWSRGEELVTDRFPELATAAQRLPDGTVLDGEIVVWRDPPVVPSAAVPPPARSGTCGDAPIGPPVDASGVSARTPLPDDGPPRGVQPFSELQRRIGRKTLGARLLRDTPVVLLAYDLLEADGADLRARSLALRRERLDALLAAIGDPALRPSPLLRAVDWRDCARLRAHAQPGGVEGLMLKRRDGAYGIGRTRDVGLWWKWKIDPLSVDAVLIYAQRGHGRRASLYTDYTFALWDAPPQTPERRLVPFAKAYSGLSDAEIARVDAIVRRTTIETFGPVRHVTPTLVFELGFENIARSTRHKSGIAVRFPRMLRWRLDKPVDEADTLADLLALLPAAR